jgi:hypothetical protein
LDSTLDALAHSVEDLQHEKHKENSSLGRDLVSELESRLGEKVVDVMRQESGKQMDALQQETRGVMDSMWGQLQQIPAILEETVRKELEGWEKTTKSFLGKEIRDLKHVVALQTEMLTTITEVTSPSCLLQTTSVDLGSILLTPIRMINWRGIAKPGYIF